jgi:hypothetical protein
MSYSQRVGGPPGAAKPPPRARPGAPTRRGGGPALAPAWGRPGRQCQRIGRERFAFPGTRVLPSRSVKIHRRDAECAEGPRRLSRKRTLTSRRSPLAGDPGGMLGWSARAAQRCSRRARIRPRGLRLRTHSTYLRMTGCSRSRASSFQVSASSFSLRTACTWLWQERQSQATRVFNSSAVQRFRMRVLECMVRGTRWCRVNFNPSRPHSSQLRTQLLAIVVDNGFHHARQAEHEEEKK